MATKYCFKCEQVKDISEFYKNRSNRDGLQTYCKPCFGHSARKYRDTPNGRKVATEAVRRWQESNPDYVRAQSRKHHHDNPQKVKAYRAVRKAIRTGNLPKISTRICVYCSQKAKHYHHHNGYGDEHLLDVIPVCNSCHGKEHQTGSKYDGYITS